MSQNCPAPAAVRTPPAPSATAANTQGPSQHASTQAQEAFAKHLDRELEPHEPRSRSANGVEQAVPAPRARSANRVEEAAPASAPAVALAPAPALEPSSPVLLAIATSQELARAGAPAEAVPVAHAPASTLPVAGTGDLAAMLADVAATVSTAPGAPAAVPSPQTAAPALAPAGAQVSSSTRPSGGQSGPALPEADPLCALEGVPPHAPASPPQGVQSSVPAGAGALTAAIPAIPATPALPATPPTSATPATPPAVATPPAAQAPAAQPPAGPTAPADVSAEQPSEEHDDHQGHRADRTPGPPAHAAAWQQASPPAHSSSPLAGNVPLDPGAQVQPTAPAGTAPAAPAPRQGVLLAHAAETLRLTISAANAQGVSRARIALKPAELGGIEIMLAHGPAGLSATVTADSAQAALALQRAADELHRTLAEQGLSFVKLEISVAGEGPQARGREDRGAAADDHGANSDSDATDDDPAATRTLELPNGVLVDVLA